jgi:RNA 3'-terminal phosphate cyclase (ATP)
MGEGGGQILRSSLALSLITSTPFRLQRIRARREKPGLARQHLTAVQAAAAVGGATVEGAALRSEEITFVPRGVRPGEYHFAVGTAGNASLVLQTILPPLLLAPAPSLITVEGGTHNRFAPPFDFLAEAFLPLLARAGHRVSAELERPGFYPAGGGRFAVYVEPHAALSPLTLLERGAVRRRNARAVVARLPRHIAERELAVVAAELGFGADELHVVTIDDAIGPGNALIVEIESEHVTEVFTGVGERGLRAELVAARAIEAAREYLAAGVPVGPHLADQLLLPLAIGRGGAFRTLPLTTHSTTNIDVIRRFLDVRIGVRAATETVTVEVTGAR